MRFFIIIILFCSFSSATSQKPSFILDQIVTKNLDTLIVSVRFRGDNKLDFTTRDGEKRTLLKEEISSYSEGTHYYETLILNSRVYVMAKKVIVVECNNIEYNSLN